MSRSERDKLEAQREARRAKRLSERAEQRARRKAEQAKRAAERAEQLAEEVGRTHRSNPRRHRERSIEDVVDDVTDKWTRKAESWIDEQSKKMFDDGSASYGYGSDGYGSDGYGASDGSDDYSGVEDDGSGYYDSMEGDGTRREAPRRSSIRRKQRRKERMRRRKERIRSEFGFERERKHFKRRNRNGNLYRNSQNKKIFGVCSGIADYWGMETWQVRMMAVVALFVIPSIAVPGYFISSFLMDDKPYYRKVTDRFHELDEETSMDSSTETYSTPGTAGSKAANGDRRFDSKQRSQFSSRSNVEVLQNAKHRFSDIENRLRVMETHVTSPKFELQRELKKIAGDEV